MKRMRFVLMFIVLILLGVVVGGLVAMRYTNLLEFLDRETVEEYVLPLDGSIITNIKDSSRLVKCELVIILNNEDEYNALYENSFKINDIVIEILRGLEEQEYKKTDIQETLSQEIITKLEAELEVEGITDVYFKQLITQ